MGSELHADLLIFLENLSKMTASIQVFFVQDEIKGKIIRFD